MEDLFRRSQVPQVDGGIDINSPLCNTDDSFSDSSDDSFDSNEDFAILQVDGGVDRIRSKTSSPRRSYGTNNGGSSSSSSSRMHYQSVSNPGYANTSNRPAAIQINSHIRNAYNPSSGHPQHQSRSLSQRPVIPQQRPYVVSDNQFRPPYNLQKSLQRPCQPLLHQQNNDRLRNPPHNANSGAPTTYKRPQQQHHEKSRLPSMPSASYHNVPYVSEVAKSSLAVRRPMPNIQQPPQIASESFHAASQPSQRGRLLEQSSSHSRSHHFNDLITSAPRMDSKSMVNLMAVPQAFVSRNLDGIGEALVVPALMSTKAIEMTNSATRQHLEARGAHEGRNLTNVNADILVGNQSLQNIADSHTACGSRNDILSEAISLADLSFTDDSVVNNGAIESVMAILPESDFLFGKTNPPNYIEDIAEVPSVAAYSTIESCSELPDQIAGFISSEVSISHKPERCEIREKTTSSVPSVQRKMNHLPSVKKNSPLLEM